MKSICHIAALSLMLTSGCVMSRGLSPRETPGNDYSTLIFTGLPLPGAGMPTTFPLTMRQKPLGLGVAQVGEVAPPALMLAIIRSRPDLVARAEPLPGICDVDENEPVFVNAPASAAVGTTNPTTAPSEAALLEQRYERRRARARRAVDQMRAVAADMGLDYLVLYGGTVDSHESDTPLAVFDLTIVGFYLFPSRIAEGEAKAAAALIDVHSGRIVFTVSAEAAESGLAPYAGLGEAMTNELNAARDEVRDSLARQLLVRLQ